MDEDRGGNVAGALSAMVHIPDIASTLVPDYQRDLVIDTQDRYQATNGVPLNLWINDDDDGRSQDYAEKDEDIPGASYFSDETNKEVDGVSDLLDFFPIHIDAQALFAFLEKRKEIKETYANGALTIRLSQADKPSRQCPQPRVDFPYSCPKRCLSHAKYRSVRRRTQ